jgi:3-oxoacyl-(acyl-carrier-protein) reductase
VNQPRSARITGWGAYAPPHVLTNDDLSLIVDTSDEWIASRTGIRERRVAGPLETTATMGAIAGGRAIAVAGIDPDDIDIVLVATLTPDHLTPSASVLVKEAIGATRAAAFDLGAACSGFVYGFATAHAYVMSGLARNVLVIGSELLTRFLDWTDRNTCVLFGDGAGAVVVSASDEAGGGMTGLELTADPSGAWSIWIPAGGARRPSTAATVAGDEQFLRMDGRETYRYATRTIASTALSAIERAGWTADQVDLFIPHQANVRIIESVAKGLGIPMERIFRSRSPRPWTRGVYGPATASCSWPSVPGSRAAPRPSPGRRTPPTDGGPRACRRRRTSTSPPTGTPATRCPSRWPGSSLASSRPRCPRDRGTRYRPHPGGARMIDLSGKSAVVTGGSRGIGRAIVLRLATQGADVAFSYRGNAPAAEATAAEVRSLGRKATPIAADVSQPDSAEALVKGALEELGKVDILVNNAGITRDDLIMRMDIDAWREVLETNLFGAFYTLKAVTRPMLKARSGRIINITSVSGQAGQMGQANYSSAKAGLIGLTKAAARELASRGITVNAVAPGFVLTELTQDLPGELKDELVRRTPLGRFGTTQEVADAVAFLASDEAAYITGQVLAVDGGLVMM